MTSDYETHRHHPWFAGALAVQVGVAERGSRPLGIGFLYVAGPISGGAVRLAYPLSEIDAAGHQAATTLVWGSLFCFAFAMVVAAFAAQHVAQRLRRIVDFAERVAAGDLTARIASTATDEIGQVAAALDKTTLQIETS